jgi:hypothetical protein
MKVGIVQRSAHSPAPRHAPEFSIPYVKGAHAANLDDADDFRIAGCVLDHVSAK